MNTHRCGFRSFHCFDLFLHRFFLRCWTRLFLRLSKAEINQRDQSNVNPPEVSSPSLFLSWATIHLSPVDSALEHSEHSSCRVTRREHMTVDFHPDARADQLPVVLVSSWPFSPSSQCRSRCPDNLIRHHRDFPDCSPRHRRYCRI